MTNITYGVWKFLDNNPCIRKNMEQGLLNMRALAKYIIKYGKFDATLDAVISALRRYEIDEHDKIFVVANEMLSRTINLSTRSGLVELSLVKETEVQRLLPDLFGLIQYARGNILRVMQASETLRILIDEKNLEEVKALFPKDKILTVDKKFAEINMYIHPEMQVTPGVLAVITNELAVNGINIREVMTCSPEILWFVREEDLLNAYHVLYQLCRFTKS